MNYSEEVWKDIYDFKEKYEVSNCGRIRNKITNHILKFTNQYGDYFSIILYDNNHKRTTRVHREVAVAFIPNPNNLPVVNHKNCNKQDNRVENLEWCSYRGNVLHAIKNNRGTIEGINKYNKNRCFEKYGYIYQFDKNMNFVGKYKSAKEAQEKTKVCGRNILHCINHQEGRKQAGGYVWLKESEVVINEHRDIRNRLIG